MARMRTRRAWVVRVVDGCVAAVRVLWARWR
jgi:hypothetical protein